jgi:hypothetical protein
MPTAYSKNVALVERLRLHGAVLSLRDASILRRAERTLHQWAERCCGYDTGHASVAYGRDDESGKPFAEIHPHTGRPSYREPIVDRETNALKRVAKICTTYGLHFYHQTDPRGCALYVDTKPLTESDYSNGVCCSQ